MNVRGAYLEVFADSPPVPGVQVAAVVLIAFDWEPIDAIIGVAIGLFMVRAPCGSRGARACSPRWHPRTSTSTRCAPTSVRSQVVGVHDVHVDVDQRDGRGPHRVMVRNETDHHSVLDQARTLLRDQYGIDHATFQVEPEDHHGCEDMRGEAAHRRRARRVESSAGRRGGRTRCRAASTATPCGARKLTVAYLADAIGVEAGAAAGRSVATAHDEWTPWPTTGDGDGDGAADRYRRARPRARRRVRTDQPRVPHARHRSARGVDPRVGEQTLLAWMLRDVERPPEVRIHTWAGMLHGNFAAITVTEDDEKFVITQNPCGSCGRQLECGALPGPLDHATVTEVHLITFDSGDVPIYRTHVAVMHFLMAEERLGVPWRWWRALEARAVRISLYKDPRNPAARRDAGASGT